MNLYRSVLVGAAAIFASTTALSLTTHDYSLGGFSTAFLGAAIFGACWNGRL